MIATYTDTANETTMATSSHHHSHSLLCVFWSSGGYPKCDCGLLASAKAAKPVRISAEVAA